MSSTITSNDSHANSAVECQKITHKESSPPNLFNNSSGLKYLHKKFKRAASTVIEDICDKVKTNVDASQTLNVTDSALKQSDITPLHNLNGESVNVAATIAHTADIKVTTADAGSGAAAIIINVQSHINESVTNSHDFATKCIQCRKLLNEHQHHFCNECNPEHLNASAKYGHGVLRNEFSSKHNVMGGNIHCANIGGGSITIGTVTAATTTTATATATSTTQHPYKQYEVDFLDSLSKCKTDTTPRIMTVSPLQQKTNYEYEPYAEDYRTKRNTIAGNVPQNFKENLLRGTQFDRTVQTLNASISSKNMMGSNSVSASNKISTRRKNCDRPWICATCGIECKSKGLLHKHCRFVTIFLSFFFNLYFDQRLASCVCVCICLKLIDHLF